MTNIPPRSRGHLNPGDPRVAFDRFTLGPELDALVRHVWIVRWSVPPGEEAAQRVLSYPAFNAVLETAMLPHDTAHELTAVLGLFPPSGRVSVRRLRGRGAAVGVLLRPCAGRVLLSGGDPRPVDVPPGGIVLPDAPAHDLESALRSGRSARVAEVLGLWLEPLTARIDERDHLVNEACRLAEEDASLDRAAELAARLGVTPRSLERTLRDYLGLTPKWLIECRRLQAAAVALHAHPETDLTSLAVDLGFADYAHFSRRYRAVLGETPNVTRQSAPEAATVGTSPLASNS